jgi:hypothetical protein
VRDADDIWETSRKCVESIAVGGETEFRPRFAVEAAGGYECGIAVVGTAAAKLCAEGRTGAEIRGERGRAWYAEGRDVRIGCQNFGGEVGGNGCWFWPS